MNNKKTVMTLTMTASAWKDDAGKIVCKFERQTRTESASFETVEEARNWWECRITIENTDKLLSSGF